MCDGGAQSAVGDPVRGAGEPRFITASELVVALRAGFDTGEAAFDGEVYRLIVPDYEMQEGGLRIVAPLGAIEGIRPDHV